MSLEDYDCYVDYEFFKNLLSRGASFLLCFVLIQNVFIRNILCFCLSPFIVHNNVHKTCRQCNFPVVSMTVSKSVCGFFVFCPRANISIIIRMGESQSLCVRTKHEKISELHRWTGFCRDGNNRCSAVL